MISSTTKRKVAATAMFLAGAVALQQAPANAALTNGWGYWMYTSEVDTMSGSLTFATGQVNATWTSEGTDGYSPEISQDTMDEYYNSSTPIGAAFAANGPSADNNFMRVYAPAGDNNNGIIHITFDSPVPAGKLAIAISDIDSDEAYIVATTDGTTQLTQEELAGVSSSDLNSLAFNFCATRNDSFCANETDVVPVSDSGSNTIKAGSRQDTNLWGTDGSSDWLHPAAAVKTLDITVTNGDDNGDSSERIALVQQSGTADVLAATGSNTGDQITVAAVAFGAGAAILATTRRRKARA